MLKYAIALLLSLSTLKAHAVSLADETGNYRIASCSSSGNQTIVNYCQYDELNISKDGADPTATRFEFSFAGKSLLGFAITSKSMPGDVLLTQNIGKKIILRSTDNGIKSETSIEPYKNGKLLILSSSGAGGSYQFDLFLLK